MYSSLINSLITNKRFMHMVLTTRTSWCTCITQNELCGLQRQEFALWSCCRPDAACRWHAVAPVGRVLSAWRAFSVVDRGAPAPMQCSRWRCRRAKRRSASRLTCRKFTHRHKIVQGRVDLKAWSIQVDTTSSRNVCSIQQLITCMLSNCLEWDKWVLNSELISLQTLV